MKICNKCKLEKENTYFNKRKLKSGLIILRSECILCAKRRTAQYKKIDKVAIREKEVNAQYYKQHKELIDNYNKEYCSRLEIVEKRAKYHRELYIKKHGFGKFKNENKCREIFESIFKEPFLKRRPIELKDSNGKRLELDGYCPKLKLAFEYDGEQHFKVVKHHKSDIETLSKIKNNDKIKDELCKLANINLIRIPYWEQKDLRAYIEKQLILLNIAKPHV